MLNKVVKSRLMKSKAKIKYILLKKLVIKKTKNSKFEINHFVVQLRLCDHGLQVDSSLLLLLEDDIWRILVEPDAEALQLLFDQPLVLQRLQDVEHDEDQRTGSSDGDDLFKIIKRSLFTLTNFTFTNCLQLLLSEN